MADHSQSKIGQRRMVSIVTHLEKMTLICTLCHSPELVVVRWIPPLNIKIVLLHVYPFP